MIGKKKFVSLNIKIFFLALAVSIIPSALVGTLLYRKSIDIVRQKQDALVKNTFKSIANTIELNMENARSISLYIISNDDIRSALLSDDMSQSSSLKNQNILLDNLFFFTGHNSYVSSIHIKGEKGLEVYNGLDGSVGKFNSEIDSTTSKKIKEQNGGSVWQWGETERGTVLSLIREIRNKEKPEESLGILKIDISRLMIEEQFENFIDVYPGYISLYDENGNEIYSFGTSVTQNNNTVESMLTSSSVEWKEVNNKKEDMLAHYYKIPNREWILASNIQFSVLYAENNIIMALLIGGIGISLVLCILLIFMFSRAVLGPLVQLTSKIGEIAGENYKIRLDFHSNDEIGVLSNSFNMMASRLDELVNEVLKGKVLRRDAQLKALQAQINPHFLYNNLDTAYWMSRIENAEKTGKILLSLSALYRSTVSTAGKMISAKTEIQYAQDYVVIQQLRLDAMIEFEFEIEESLAQYTTLRFLLQPLIENSIEHGILSTGAAGKIIIKAYKKDEELIYEVIDSGQGTSLEELAELLSDVNSNEERGMAIRNIHSRIQLQFGIEYGLDFKKNEPVGLCAVVRQPIMIFEQESS